MYIANRNSTYAFKTDNLGNILANISQGRYEIPAIQRPFVWGPDQVCRLVESAYKGIPLGDLCIWNKGDVRLQNGETSKEESLLVIDGQQRLGALKTALLGEPILTEDFEEKRITIAFNPLDGKFSSRRETGEAWVPDISVLFTGETVQIRHQYREALEQHGKSDLVIDVEKRIDRLSSITDAKVCVNEIHSSTPYETVYEIFQNINKGPTRVKEAQVCVAEIQTHHPNVGEVINRFCRGLRDPGVTSTWSEDSNSEGLNHLINWMEDRGFSQIAYRPAKVDIVNVLVMLTKREIQLEKVVGQFSPNDARLKAEINADLTKSLSEIINESNFMEFNRLMVPLQAFSNDNLATTAYWLYIHCLNERQMSHDETEKLIQRWVLASSLQDRDQNRSERVKTLSGFLKVSPSETMHSYIDEFGDFLTEEFFAKELPQQLKKDLAQSNVRTWRVWQTVQALAGDTALFSTDAVVKKPQNSDTLNRHHIYPKQNLIELGVRDRKSLDCVANRVITTRTVNQDIDRTKLDEYIAQKYGSVEKGIDEQLKAHCIPPGAGNMGYYEFLDARADLMAAKIRKVYEGLVPKTPNNPHASVKRFSDTFK